MGWAPPSSVLLAQQGYLACGQLRTVAFAPGAITQTDFGYTGQRDVESLGLMDYKARFYDPALGRFTQPDTIVPNAANPQSWNRYTYVVNDPIRLSDPSGRRVACGVMGEACENEPLTIMKAHDRSREEDGGPIGPPDACTTVTCGAVSGDPGALPELLTPTHGGARIQLEGTAFFISGTLGGNLLYNRIDHKWAVTVDWAIGGGPGIGAGAAVTGGPVLGWASTSIEDVASGNSIVLSGSAAAEEAVTVSLSVPVGKNGLHVDAYYGQVPVTAFGGYGKGGAFADAGVSWSGGWLRFDPATVFHP